MRALLKITALSVAIGGMLQASCYTANGCPTPCPSPVVCPTVVLCPAPPPPKVVVVDCPTVYVVQETIVVDCCVSVCNTTCTCCD